MNNIITDTGFWYALYDKRDQHHEKANELAEYLELGNILLPFPTLYESINTRFTRRKEWVKEFYKVIKKDNVVFIEDVEYKNDALNLSFENTINLNRPISLVDSVIRLMLDDKNLKVDYLITFNPGDFFDICKKRKIKLILD